MRVKRRLAPSSVSWIFFVRFKNLQKYVIGKCPLVCQVGRFEWQRLVGSGRPIEGNGDS
jgi:hypothetical protein